MSYIRLCPRCNKEIIHTRKGNCSHSQKLGRPCRSCTSKISAANEKNGFFGRKHTSETRKKISEARAGQRNSPATEFHKGHVPHGKSNYQIWSERYSPEEVIERVEKWKKAESRANSGVNNAMYGRPAPTGSGNGWSGWYKGWYFRSIHELSYMVNVIEQKDLSWQTGEQQKYRVRYTSPYGKTRNYFPDFIIAGTRMVECKPSRLHNTPSVQAKRQAAVKWCSERNMTFELVCPILLAQEKLSALIETGQVQLLKRYADKYKERFSSANNSHTQRTGS